MLRHILLILALNVLCTCRKVLEYLLSVYRKNSWERCLENDQVVITLVFPQQIVGNNRNSDCLSIYLIYGARYFLRKHNIFLAVCCTLLSNSYLAIYLQKTTTQKRGKKKKEGIKKSAGLEPCTFTSTQLHLTTTPHNYNYVIVRESLSFYSFSMKLPMAR